MWRLLASLGKPLLSRVLSSSSSAEKADPAFWRACAGLSGASVPPPLSFLPSFLPPGLHLAAAAPRKARSWTDSPLPPSSPSLSPFSRRNRPREKSLSRSRRNNAELREKRAQVHVRKEGRSGKKWEKGEKERGENKLGKNNPSVMKASVSHVCVCARVCACVRCLRIATLIRTNVRELYGFDCALGIIFSVTFRIYRRIRTIKNR